MSHGIILSNKVDTKAFKNKRGAVTLVLVIWVMVVLIAIVGEFIYSMRTELKIARNFKEEEESYQSAIAGIELAKLEILSVKDPTYVHFNDEGILAFKAEGEDEAEAESYSRNGELGNVSYSYIITDEDGKLNINNASSEQLRYIFENAGVDITEIDTIVDSILDWRDTNDLHRLNGAEEDYYQSLEIPYSSKDGPFYIIYELLLVKGMTPEIFYGSAVPEMEKGKSEDEEKESAEKEEPKEYSGVVDLLTSQDLRRVNINTAPREVLEAVFGANDADNIIIQRDNGPILTPIANGAVTSIYFTVISTGTASDGKIKRTIKTTMKKSGNKLEVIYWNDNFTG